MRTMTRRQAVRTIVRSVGGLMVVRCLPGCATQDGAGGTNGNDGGLDPTLLRIDAEDHVIGDPQAPDLIIEYGDFQCPTCGDFFRDNRPSIITHLVETGQAAFVFRHFPQPRLHPDTRLAAVASECAVDFFEYHDLLFSNQDAFASADLVGYAEQVGLSTAAFENCLVSGAKMPRVDRDLDSGTRLGVVETPTFFVNDRFFTGNRSLEDFQVRLS